ncbi:MAG: hypothetical protein JO211_11290 [Acidobacteriaceae bacterium]|nr:hypothetical protein [Acidobacteriaceae bacterium]
MSGLSNASRRHFLKQLSGASALALPLGASASGARSSGASLETSVPEKLPIQHVLVCINENRSFDHYYGYAPFVKNYGVPAGYTQPNGQGGTVTPQVFYSPVTPNPNHDWVTIHEEWDKGKMDGFYTANGEPAMLYYTQETLPFYYSLFPNFTLCVNYHCSLLGPTFPNRLYAGGGTSGGITTNNITAGELDWAIILDLLEDHCISWKVYGIEQPCSVSNTLESEYCDNTFQLFKRWYTDPRVTSYDESDYYSDLKNGTLPQVCFVQTDDISGEHPPYDLDYGQSLQKKLITALMNSDYWLSSAYIFTYDEAGGFFDHVAPPVLDAYGAGIRVPTWIISPYAKRAHLEPTFYEHSSILKFIERVFQLPTLASLNHQFDKRTPGGANNQAAATGATYGPPAPPRDGRKEVGDLFECFSF